MCPKHNYLERHLTRHEPEPVLSTAPINPNRHAIDKLLLEGKKHKRPLKSSPQPIHHGSSGQANDVGAPVPVTQSQDVAGSISFNQFAPYQAPVSPTSTYPSLPTPPYLTLAPSGNDLGFSLLEQYNHQAATPSGADRWDRAVSGNLAAINYALGTCEHQNIAFQQQGMALQQQAISLNQRQIQPDHHLMNTGQSAFIEGYSNEQDPMSTEFDDSFSTPMTYESWTHNGGWDSAFKSP